MILRATRLVAVLLAMLFIAACASPGGTLQAAGTVAVFDLQVDSSLAWARIKRSRSEVWTIDGTALNQLHFYSRVKPGEHVFQLAKERRSRPDGPWYRRGMRLDELQQLVVDGLADQGFAGVDGSQLRPHAFGDVDGLRFDLAMANGDGLLYQGTAAVAERNGLLTVVFWLAPKEHYHGRDVAAVNAMLDGLRFQ